MIIFQAIAGEIGMDNILDNIANSLFNGQLPAYWAKLAPATCKQLGGWMDHLQVNSKDNGMQFNFFNVNFSNNSDVLCNLKIGLHLVNL